MFLLLLLWLFLLGGVFFCNMLQLGSIVAVTFIQVKDKIPVLVMTFKEQFDGFPPIIIIMMMMMMLLI